MDHSVGIEFLACLSHAADIKYGGKDARHEEYGVGIGDITLVSRVFCLPEQADQAREKMFYDFCQFYSKMKLFQMLSFFSSCNLPRE